KNWPKRELDGLTALETETEPRILPILHNLSNDELKQFSPILAGRKNISSEIEFEEIIREIIRAIEGTMPLPEFFPEPAHDFLLPSDIRRAFQQIPEFSPLVFSGE